MTEQMRLALDDAQWDEEEYDPKTGRLSLYTPHCRELLPGVIDGEARAYFGYGACALLALELYRQHDLPLVLVRGSTSDPEQTFVHALNLTSTGELLDIFGTHQRDSLLSHWQRHGATHLQEVDEKTFLSVVGDDFDAFSPVELAAAHDFANLLHTLYSR
jgi:hypothetical protein